MLWGRKPMVLPNGPNRRWTLDFVSDVLTDGRRFRIRAVIDDFSPENLMLVADTSLSGPRVARVLDQMTATLKYFFAGRPFLEIGAAMLQHARKILLPLDLNPVKTVDCIG